MEPTIWCRVRVLGPGGAAVHAFAVAGHSRPDIAAVAAVASAALHARRIVGRVVLSDVSPEMAELRDLVRLPVEVERQPERREERLELEQVQEETQLGDPPIHDLDDL